MFLKYDSEKLIQFNCTAIINQTKQQFDYSPKQKLEPNAISDTIKAFNGRTIYN